MAENLLDNARVNEAKVVRIPNDYNKFVEMFNVLSKKVKDLPLTDNLWKLRDWVGNEVERRFGKPIEGFKSTASNVLDEFYKSIKNIYDDGVSVSSLNPSDKKEYQKIMNTLRPSRIGKLGEEDTDLANLGIFKEKPVSNAPKRERSDEELEKIRIRMAVRRAVAAGASEEEIQRILNGERGVLAKKRVQTYEEKLEKARIRENLKNARKKGATEEELARIANGEHGVIANRTPLKTKEEKDETQRRWHAAKRAMELGASAEDIQRIMNGDIRSFSDIVYGDARKLKSNSYLWNLRNNLNGDELRNYLLQNGIARRSTPEDTERLTNFINGLSEKGLFNFIDHVYGRNFEPGNEWQKNVIEMLRNISKNHTRDNIKKWQLSNNDKMDGYVKKWRENNSEKYNEYQKKWRENNKDWISEHNKLYYQKNIERIKAYMKKWREENPERVKEMRDAWAEKIKSLYGSLYKYNTRNNAVTRNNPVYVRSTKDWFEDVPNEELLRMYRENGNIDAFNGWFQKNYKQIRPAVEGTYKSILYRLGPDLANSFSKQGMTDVYNGLKNALANNDGNSLNIEELYKQIARNGALQELARNRNNFTSTASQLMSHANVDDFHDNVYGKFAGTSDFEGNNMAWSSPENEAVINDDFSAAVRAALEATESDAGEGRNIFNILMNTQMPSRSRVYENGMSRATGLSRDYIKRRLDEAKRKLIEEGLIGEN